MEHPSRLDDVRTVSISRVEYPAGRYAHHATGLFQLRIVRSGSSYADIDLGAGLRHVFTRPGDMLLSLGDRPVTFAIQEGRDLALIQASRQRASEVLSLLGGRLADLVPLTDRPHRDPLIAKLCARVEGKVSADISREWAFDLIVSFLLAAARRREAAPSADHLTPQRLAAVEASIDAGIDREITVSGLAAIAGMRKRAFSTSFREATGLPVYQFVLRRRADRAVDILRSTSIPFAEVASRTGFSHQAHMTRVVGQLKGNTPSNIRAQGARRKTGAQSAVPPEL